MDAAGTTAPAATIDPAGTTASTRTTAPAGLLARRPGLTALGARLLRALTSGARIGESAVVSTRVHLLDPRDPDAVTVVADRDAGRVFYGRRFPDEIVHIDVFHAVAEIDCRRVAAAAREALAAYRGDAGCSDGGPSPDHFDVQTGTGGGRITGSLQFGRRASLRTAHRNHVHLAGRLMARDAAACFYLVAGVEATIAAAGVEVRRVERIHVRGCAESGAPQDLSPYSSETDTLLREDRGAAARGPDATGAGASEDALLAAAARLADDVGGVDAARALLAALARPAPLADIRPAGWNPARAREAIARLHQHGWVETVSSLWTLSPAGQRLEQLFHGRLREVELALRTAARRVVVSGGRGSWPSGAVRPVPAPHGRGRRAVERRPGQAIAEICLPETVAAALVRRPERLRVEPPDIRVRRRVRPRRTDLCLLLDASASMEGGRMRAAKTLARHLLLTSRDRVAVMAFQERGAQMAVPFTRNYAAAERGLRCIDPAGLTPLAAGLAAARDYLQRSHAKNPLLLLVTDGIPTVSLAGGSPLDEALAEAGRMAGCGLSLCCIGLEPNERYLRELAHRAGGRLHVVSELRPDVLAQLARAERLRHAGA